MKYVSIVFFVAILMLSSGCMKREPKATSQYITIQPGTTTIPTYPNISDDPSTDPILTMPVFDESQLYSPYLGGAYASNSTLHRFINKMVAKHNFNRNYLYGLFSTVSRDTKALDKYGVYRAKPKITKLSRPGEWDRYRKQFITPSRIGKGIQFWKENRHYLEKAARQYGVAPEYIVGIIGVETNFGSYTGDHKVLDALTTLSIEYRKRSKFFIDQLENYLLLTREQKIDPRSIRGSYAGAFGLAQFMPDSFREYGVDHDEDGRVNLFNKADAIGSIANFFVKKGKWNPHIPVAVLTRYPKPRFYGLSTGGKTSYSQSHLYALGMRPINNFYGYKGNVSLIKLNRYNRDELWWATPNFYSIMRYNPKEYYAMAVHQLAQAIRINYYQSLQ